MTLIRYLLCLLGILLAMPLLVLIVLAFKLPITTSGMYYLIAGSFVASGLIAAPLLPRHFLYLVFAGVIGLFLIIGIRLIVLGQNRSTEIQMITLPKGKGSRWLGSIIDEQDGLIFGEELFHLIGGDSAREHEGLVPAFLTAYSGMKSQGMFPSPLVNTYLDIQRPNAFDAVIITPQEPPKFGVVFLHGYMGNVTAQCWEIAQAVKPLGGLTVCPSTEWRGEWWQPRGQAILKSTFAYLRGRGIQKFYLGGFSNGGFSIGHLALQLGSEQGLGGLIFIDGIYDGTSIKETGLPILIIEGLQDERVPAVAVRLIAEQIGESATYTEMEGDHFLIMKHPAAVQNAITNWLEQFESR